jgi:hypothetical protein
MRLSQPPPARLAIAPPLHAYLTGDSAAEYAAAVATAMQEEALPAVTDAARPGDWRLELQAELRGNDIVPGFRVRDPSGAERGTTEARPVSAAVWANASPDTLRSAARDAAPTIAALLAGIEAARRDADPNSLVNRPVQIHLAEVRGAPGDGNRSLARHMRDQLVLRGMALREDAAGADYRIAGEVTVTDIAGGQQQVEIRWKIEDARGAEAGQVAQLNAVPRGTLSGLWADVALIVAQEAAGGIRDVIANQIGTRRTPATR